MPTLAMIIVVGPGQGTERSFTEPVALSCTQPADLPLPRRASRLSFDLLALRARCVEETMGEARLGQAPSQSDWRSLRPSSSQEDLRSTCPRGLRERARHHRARGALHLCGSSGVSRAQARLRDRCRRSRARGTREVEGGAPPRRCASVATRRIETPVVGCSGCCPSNRALASPLPLRSRRHAQEVRRRVLYQVCSGVPSLYQRQTLARSSSQCHPAL